MSAAIPFQINVGGRSAAGYELRVTSAGRVAEANLEVPTLSGDREKIGETLGQALFPLSVRQLLIDVARGADESGARLQLQLNVTTPELASLPWEWVTLGSETPWCPAIRDDYTLMRVGRATRSRPPLSVVGPVRLLIACAPGGATAAAAPLGHALAEPVRTGNLVVDLLRDADPFMLREALAEEPCHMLHVVAADAIGQGNATRLRLGRNLDAPGLAGLIADYPDLRLLTLAADLGAEAAALATIAAAVHDRLGIAAISLGDLDNAGVAAFCGPCYAALAAGDPVDLATTDGRVALANAADAWGAPRLWAIPGGERLFAPILATSDEQAVSTWSHAQPVASARPDEAAPVGTPLRPQRPMNGAGRMATRALASARAFVVDATAVGQPAQRSRPDDPRRNRISLKLVALLVACLVLVLMISQVLPSSDSPTLSPTSTLPTPALPMLGPELPPQP